MLLEMHLSDMDGVDFARSVKGDPAISGTKLIVMTGNETMLLRQQYDHTLPLGFAGWIPMPPAA